MYEMETGKTYLTRLAPGGDLYEAVSDAVKESGIRAGLLSGIGALRKAAVGIFDEESREYKVNQMDGELEICALTGNVSLKDGEPFVHCHLTLSDHKGNAFGGHCMPGCEVFVCELAIIELLGEPPAREPQEECAGLSLWPRRDKL
jgi:predicted DNA-binding protein with PD1-like motif